MWLIINFFLYDEINKYKYKYCSIIRLHFDWKSSLLLSFQNLYIIFKYELIYSGHNSRQNKILNVNDIDEKENLINLYLY